MTRVATGPLETEAEKKNRMQFKQQLHMPKDAKRYKARKLQAMLRLQERLGVKANINTYLTLLEEFTEVCDAIKKEEKARGLDKKRAKSKVLSTGDAGDVKDESSNVGVHLSTRDPFAGEGQ